METFERHVKGIYRYKEQLVLYSLVYSLHNITPATTIFKGYSWYCVKQPVVVFIPELISICLSNKTTGIL